MKALALMQNQWLANAAYHQARQDSMRVNNEPLWWKVRERAIPFALFRGCQSGRVLKRHFGDVVDEIIWEEASTIIGASASSCPPADLKHIREVLARYNPDNVIAFGKVACAGINAVMKAERIPYAFNLFQAPHPAARNPDLQESVREACVVFLNRIGRY